jgi:hypothetical protein
MGTGVEDNADFGKQLATQRILWQFRNLHIPKRTKIPLTGHLRATENLSAKEGRWGFLPERIHCILSVVLSFYVRGINYAPN